MIGVVDHDLLFHARVHLDRVVDAHTEHHGETADRHERQRDAEVAREPEGPHHTDEHHRERQ